LLVIVCLGFGIYDLINSFTCFELNLHNQGPSQPGSDPAQGLLLGLLKEYVVGDWTALHFVPLLRLLTKICKHIFVSLHYAEPVTIARQAGEVTGSGPGGRIIKNP
jgi:hypothetical protein